MIKADIHYGEGHYKTAVKNKGNPFLKAMGYSLIVAVGLAFLIKLSFDLLKYHAWILWLYGAVFIAVNGFTLVRLEVLLLGVKKSVIKSLSSVSYSVEFDEEELILRYDTKAEFGEKHLRYPVVKWADRRGEWFLINLKDTELVFSEKELTGGNAEELSALLAEKLGAKFKYVRSSDHDKS